MTDQPTPQTAIANYLRQNAADIEDTLFHHPEKAAEYADHILSAAQARTEALDVEALWKAAGHLTVTHGESCDCDACLFVQPLVDAILAAKADR